MLRLLFGPPDSPIDRRTYLIAGLSLMGLKYLIDVAVIAVFAGVFWTPADYLLPLMTFNAPKMAEFPQALNVFLLLWTLPFLWTGVVLSTRRALDADIFPGMVVTFFVPLLNYLLMLALAVAPTRTVRPPVIVPRPGPPAPAPAEPSAAQTAGTQLAIAAGAAAAVLAVSFGVGLLKAYGGAVFLSGPFLAGMISAIVANRAAPRTRRETIWIGLASIGALGALLLLFAFEGAICMVMAFPIAAPVAIMGSLTGHLIAHRDRPPSLGHLTLMLIAVPLGAGIEAAMPARATRTVLTTIEIEAPRAAVWEHVVSFSEIQPPPGWLFRTGLAYPLRARIEGRGIGAIRHCEFTTGAFVEPITVWDEPNRLAFDVIEQPPPLHEWSPYSRVYAPHLDGFFRTSHGEFRLIELSPARTRLEGRTWYALDMGPSIYWNAIADSILHAIHHRVLAHVKGEAERRQTGGRR